MPHISNRGRRPLELISSLTDRTTSVRWSTFASYSTSTCRNRLCHVIRFSDGNPTSHFIPAIIIVPALLVHKLMKSPSLISGTGRWRSRWRSTRQPNLIDIDFSEIDTKLNFTSLQLGFSPATVIPTTIKADCFLLDSGLQCELYLDLRHGSEPFTQERDWKFCCLFNSAIRPDLFCMIVAFSTPIWRPHAPIISRQARPPNVEQWQIISRTP